LRRFCARVFISRYAAAASLPCRRAARTRPQRAADAQLAERSWLSGGCLDASGGDGARGALQRVSVRHSEGGRPVSLPGPLGASRCGMCRATLSALHEDRCLSFFAALHRAD